MSAKNVESTEMPLGDLTAVHAVKAVEAGQAKDVDIAAQIIAENIGSMGDDPWTLTEDRQLMRKIDYRLIPVVRSLSVSCSVIIH